MYENNTYSYQNDQMTFNQFLTKSFGVMFTGILLTAITALFGLPILLSFIQSFIGVFLIYGINIGIAFYFSSRLMTMSKTTAYICFYLYCFVTGLTFSTLPLYYDGGTLAVALFMTAGMFACMAIIGHTSKVDFTKFTPYLFVGLIACIGMTFINAIFLHSSGVELMLDYAVIIIFLIMIAYDMQTLRHIHESAYYDNEVQNKLAIYGAFSLYLDFINIFIRVLSILGRSNDN